MSKLFISSGLLQYCNVSYIIKAITTYKSNTIPLATSAKLYKEYWQVEISGVDKKQIYQVGKMNKKNSYMYILQSRYNRLRFGGMTKSERRVMDISCN
jgi:hypothetical protein